MDSIASSLALKKVIENMGKKVMVLSPDEISYKWNFIGNISEITVKKDINGFNFDDFDLWIMTDTSGWEHVRLDGRPEKIKIVNIDHHQKSEKDDAINLIDLKSSSTTEILFDLFKDWEVKIDKPLAQLLLTGIVFDTDFFRNLNTTMRSHQSAADLIELGADNSILVKKIDNDLELNQLYLWRELLNNFKIEEEYNFVWSAISYDFYNKYPVSQSITSIASENIFRRIENFDFTAVMCETRPGYLGISFRSINPDFKILPIAIELGGGGHEVAGGASVEGLPFKEAVKKVLEVARKYAKKYKKD